MTKVSTATADPTRHLLRRVGARVRAARKARDMTRRRLAETSGVSERFLAQLETGAGNVSIARLHDVAVALGVTLDELVIEQDLGDRARALMRAVAAASPAERAALAQRLAELRESPESDRRERRVALIGLRGAGKSSLGRATADRLGVPFVELNRQIEAASGISVNEIFSLYGEEGFRRLERRCLEEVADRHHEVVLATPGGVVGEPDNYEVVLERFHAVWLRAAPEEHMERVRAQGDQRPMSGHPRAMDDLRAILERRERDYSRAPHQLDTSSRALESSIGDLIELCTSLFDRSASSP